MKILLLIIFVFSCFNAVAGSLTLTNVNGVEYRQAGNVFTWGYASPESTAIRGGKVISDFDISDVEPKATARVPMPYKHNGGDVRANFDLPVNPKDVANQASKAAKSAAGGAAAGGAYGAVAGLACAFICEPLIGALADWGVDQFKKGQDGEIYIPQNDPNATTGTSDGNEYRVRNANTGWFFSREAACKGSSSYFSSIYPNYTVINIGMSGSMCLVTYKYNKDNSLVTNFTFETQTMVSPCTAGSPVVNNQCNGQPDYIDRPLADFIESRYGLDGWGPHFAAVTAGIIAAGGNVFTDGTGGQNPGSITGPSAVPQGTTTTSSPTSVVSGTTTEAPPGYSGETQPGTKTTTKTKTTTNTYSGPKQTTGTSTTTITSITNNITNITNITDTTTEVSDDPPEEEPITDTPDPDLPELYKQKYPDGLTGVVSQKVAAIKATPLFQLPNQLMGNLPNTGSCPSWTLDLNLASWASLGTWNIGADCSVWAFGKVCIIIGALLLARALITGG